MAMTSLDGKNSSSLVEKTMAQVVKDEIRFVDLQFTDVVGIVKSVTIPVSQFAAAVEHGKWFDGSSIEGFARIAESDMYLIPDLTTYALIPWHQAGDPRTARLISWVYNPNGELFPGDPRAVLMRAMKEALKLGLTFNAGPELEFFLFQRDDGGKILPLPHDQASYFDLSTDLAYSVRKEMVDDLEAMGIRVETSHHEVAVGQHEIDFEYADAITAADNAVTFRYMLKAVAQRHGLYATFMPKPLRGINGSGMHTHQSFFTADGQNAFADPNDEYGLSQLARWFIAGQLAHARGMSAVLAPLVNSYKRLVPGYEAPVYISWARTNRSALIRVPRITIGRPKATRVELRCPDPSCNPYLAFAVMLRAGLDGIKRKLTVPEAVEENLYSFDEEELAKRQIATLPGSLGEALEEMQRDDLVHEALGAHVYERFIEAKKLEWSDYCLSVSQWELDRYLKEI
jgi:glutamine synthetase